MNILVVDDNAEYRFLMDLTLSLTGHRTYVAADGEEGVNILDSTDIDLIISDIKMPRMDGIRFNAHVRGLPKYATTKFIFVSGFKEVYREAMSPRPELDFFLDKTTPSEEIIRFVNHLLNKDSKSGPAGPS